MGTDKPFIFAPKHGPLVPAPEIQEVITSHKRVAVTGGPYTGKGIVFDWVRENQPDRVLHHNDMYMPLGWPKIAGHLAECVEGLDDYVVIGLRVPWAIKDHKLKADVIIHCEGVKGGGAVAHTSLRRASRKAVWKQVNLLQIRTNIPVVYLDDFPCLERAKAA